MVLLSSVRDQVFSWSSVADTEGPVPLKLGFSDLSTGDPISWAWDFGDGGASAEQDPIHTYLQPGLYTVTPTVSNAMGSDTAVKASYITVDKARIYLPLVVRSAP